MAAAQPAEADAAPPPPQPASTTQKQRDETPHAAPFAGGTPASHECAQRTVLSQRRYGIRIMDAVIDQPLA